MKKRGALTGTSTTSQQVGNPNNRGKISAKKPRKHIEKDSIVEQILHSVKPERRLRVSRVGHTTLVRYHQHVVLFQDWCKSNKRAFSTERQVDVSMSIFFNFLVDDGASHSMGSYTLFGWIALRMVPHRAERDLLPLSRAALNAWKARNPGSSRVGVPPQVIFAFASYCVQQQHFHAAVAALLQYDLYARPSEILNITGSDLVSPVRGMTGSWGVIFGNADRDERTKTGSMDDVVLADSAHRGWCGTLLGHIGKKMKRCDHYVFNVTLAKYEELFRSFSALHKLPVSLFTPHTLRHSGPSFDAIHFRRTLPEIQQRGRWAAPSSVQRYKKPGRLLLEASRLPPSLQNFDCSKLQLALSTILAHAWVPGAPLALP